MSYTIVVYYTYDRVAFIMRTEERDDKAQKRFLHGDNARGIIFLESLDGASAL